MKMLDDPGDAAHRIASPTDTRVEDAQRRSDGF